MKAYPEDQAAEDWTAEDGTAGEADSQSKYRFNSITIQHLAKVKQGIKRHTKRKNNPHKNDANNRHCSQRLLVFNAIPCR